MHFLVQCLCSVHEKPKAEKPGLLLSLRAISSASMRSNLTTCVKQSDLQNIQCGQATTLQMN